MRAAVPRITPHCVAAVSVGDIETLPAGDVDALNGWGRGDERAGDPRPTRRRSRCRSDVHIA